MTANILVPLDGSELGESALPLLVTLARLTCSGITLLRAVPTATPTSTPTATATRTATDTTSRTTTPAAATAERPIGTLTRACKPGDTEGLGTKDEDLLVARAYLDTIGKRLEEAGLRVRTEIVQDHPPTAIAHYVEQNPRTWLIAMAAKHHRPSASWRLGSVTERVLHTTHKPVLLVRSPMNGSPDSAEEARCPEEAEEQSLTESGLHTIIVPLDGSQFAEDALEQARHIALLTGATLALVCAVPPSRNADIEQAEFTSISEEIARGYETARLTRYLAITASQLRVEGLKVLTELVYGHAAEMVLLTARRLHGDLIVIGAQGRRDRERLWLGSVAQKLVQGSTLPVLLMRTAEL